MHWKYIKYICIYFLYPFSRLYQSTISKRKDSIFFYKNLSKKESKFDLVESSVIISLSAQESKCHYFPECSGLFPSPYCLCQKVPGCSDFLFKNSHLLLYHIFLKFHKNMVVFLNRMSFGNSHELIIKCFMFSFTVINYLNFLPLPPCFFPLCFISIMGPYNE